MAGHWHPGEFVAVSRGGGTRVAYARALTGARCMHSDTFTRTTFIASTWAGASLSEEGVVTGRESSLPAMPTLQQHRTAYPQRVGQHVA